MWKAPAGGRRPLHVVYAGGSGYWLGYWLDYWSGYWFGYWLSYWFISLVMGLSYWIYVCGVLKFVLIWFKIGVESKLEEVLDGS